MKGDDPASSGSDGFQQPHLWTAHFHRLVRGRAALRHQSKHTYIRTYIHSSGVRHHRSGSAEEDHALAVLRKVQGRQLSMN